MSETCRICGQPSTERLGTYGYCHTHYERVLQERRGVWQADIISIVVLVLFVLLVVGLERWLKPEFSQFSLLLVGTVIAFVPAVIWMAFFYRRDRLEPEPKGMVAGLFLLGGLLASAVGIPLVENLFQASEWLNSSPVWVQLLGGLLVVGFPQEYLKYAAVRFSVYSSTEFDEFTDGIIYATAAGLGYATLLNISFVVSSGGVALGTGAIRIVLTALAHASFAGVIGYFLGRMKFEERPLWWMPLGLLIAASLNSLFSFLRGTLIQGNLSASGGMANPWLGLALAAVMASAVTGFLSRAIRRDLATVLAAEQG